jgi:hypothetical protein
MTTNTHALLVSKYGLTSEEGLLMVFVIAPIEKTPVAENRREFSSDSRSNGAIRGLQMCVSRRKAKSVFLFGF